MCWCSRTVHFNRQMNTPSFTLVHFQISSFFFFFFWSSLAHGWTSCFIHLRFITFSWFSLGTRYIDDLIDLFICRNEYFILGPPTLWANASNFVTFDVQENDLIELNCPVNYSPDLSIQWSKNNEELDPMWSAANLLIKRLVLKIEHAQPSDAGLYKCNVVNGFGNVQAQFRVNIKGKEHCSIILKGYSSFVVQPMGPWWIPSVPTMHLRAWLGIWMHCMEVSDWEWKDAEWIEPVKSSRSTRISESERWKSIGTDYGHSTWRNHCSIEMFSIG